MITVRFLCDHTLAIGDRVDASPQCPVCGERRVGGVVTSRAPRFVGTVTGPCSEYKSLDPGVVNVAPGGSLRLKES